MGLITIHNHIPPSLPSVKESLNPSLITITGYFEIRRDFRNIVWSALEHTQCLWISTWHGNWPFYKLCCSSKLCFWGSNATECGVVEEYYKSIRTSDRVFWSCPIHLSPWLRCLGCGSLQQVCQPLPVRRKIHRVRRKWVANTPAWLRKTARLTSSPPNIALLAFTLWQHLFNYCWILELIFVSPASPGGPTRPRERDMRKFSGLQ